MIVLLIHMVLFQIGRSLLGCLTLFPYLSPFPAFSPPLFPRTDFLSGREGHLPCVAQQFIARERLVTCVPPVLTWFPSNKLLSYALGSLSDDFVKDHDHCPCSQMVRLLFQWPEQS